MLDRLDIIETTSQPAAVIRLTIPRRHIEKEMDPAIQEVLAVMAEQGLSPDGPMFAHHLSLSAKFFDFEVGFPTATPITPIGRVKSSQTPGTKAAYVTYQGPYEGLFEAWRQFEEQMASRGLEISGENLWEVYAVGPETSPDPVKWQTELYRPIG